MKRRDFLRKTTLATLGSSSLLPLASQAQDKEFIIDIHQHLAFHERDDTIFMKHQDTMGIGKTVLLPAGRPVKRPSTRNGSANGLAAKVSGNEPAAALAAKHPDKYIYFCNEVPDLPETKSVLEKWLKKDARGIGEQKFHLECDSKEMQLIYQIAKEFDVPVLMHIQHNTYNLGFERLHKMLEKYPTVNFIGHAQTWWGNVDKNHDQKAMYPKGKVTPGGLTDKLLADYPNIYGDLSAGSGHNAFKRDEEQGSAFLHRHQDKLCLGTDCADNVGESIKCSGAQQIAIVRKLVPEADVRKKIYSTNAQKIIRF